LEQGRKDSASDAELDALKRRVEEQGKRLEKVRRIARELRDQVARLTVRERGESRDKPG